MFNPGAELGSVTGIASYLLGFDFGSGFVIENSSWIDFGSGFDFAIESSS